MFRFDAEKGVHFCDGMRRRDFLHAGSLGLLGLTLGDFLALKAAGAVDPGRDVNCIMLMLVVVVAVLVGFASFIVSLVRRARLAELAAAERHEPQEGTVQC